MSAVDAFALKKLQELEASYPVIKKPSDEVVLNYFDKSNEFFVSTINCRC